MGGGALFCSPQVVSCLPCPSVICPCPISPTQPLDGRELSFYFLGGALFSSCLCLGGLGSLWVQPRVQTVAWCLAGMCDGRLGTMILGVHRVVDSHSSVVGLVLLGIKMVKPANS